jgi:uncharacterized protein YlxP (DUF503 family)
MGPTSIILRFELAVAAVVSARVQIEEILERVSFYLDKQFLNSQLSLVRENCLLDNLMVSSMLYYGPL